MPISFNCPQCGKSYTTSDETAGKRARCKQCGDTMTIPKGVELDPYAFSDPSPADLPPPRGFDDEDEVLPKRATYRTQPKSSGNSAKVVGGVVSVLGVLGIIALKVALRVALHAGRGHGGAAPPADPPAIVANANAPIMLPGFPDPGPGRPIAPGVEFHEIHLPGGNQPGFGGKLWLYLPSNAQPDKSLPCVLITGAGSNLLIGMNLADGDRPEHLPYVHAGFAVLAFELDGAVPGFPNVDNAAIMAAAPRFLAARAGLVNAHIALEYVLAKVPQVDPSKIFVAGHSSAGTLALLFAEHEPRLKSCAAFAPAIDLAGGHFRGKVWMLKASGLGDLAERYSPRSGEANLACPLFLFHAQGDTNTPASGSIECAERLRQMGKTVTLELVPAGDHYNSMIQEGIPRAIAWMQGQLGAMPMAAAPAPVPGPAPVPAAAPAPFPTGPTPPANAAAPGFPPPPAANGFPPPPTGPRPPGIRGPRFRPPRFRPPGMPPQ